MAKLFLCFSNIWKRKKIALRNNHKRTVCIHTSTDCENCSSGVKCVSKYTGLVTTKEE